MPASRKKAAAVLVRVGAGVYHPFNSCINDHLGAGDARLVGYVDHAAGRADAMERCLNDGILLSVERTHAVAVNDQMPDIVTVGQAGGGAVVAGRQNASIADNYCAHMGSIAGAARSHGEGDVEEILIPRWTIGLR